MQLFLYRSYEGQASQATTTEFGVHHIHLLTKTSKNGVNTHTWCFNPEKCDSRDTTFFIPCSIFDSENLIRFQFRGTPLETCNMYVSLQTIFDIHCHESYGAKDEYVFRAHLLYIISMIFAEAYMKQELECNKDLDEQIRNFVPAYEHYKSIIRQDDPKNLKLKKVINSAFEQAKEYLSDSDMSSEIAVCARRKLAMCGLSNMVTIAKDRTEVYFDEPIVHVDTQRKLFIETYNRIFDFCESNENAMDILSHIFLLGDRCIQDYLDINETKNGRTCCSSCGDICRTVDITTNNAGTCYKCRKIMCTKCERCNCSQFKSSMAISKHLFLNWKALKDMKHTQEKVTSLTKQNKCLIESNLKLCKEKESLYDSFSFIKRELKEQKADAKKERSRLLNDQNSSCAKLRKEIVDLQEINTTLKLENNKDIDAKESRINDSIRELCEKEKDFESKSEQLSIYDEELSLEKEQLCIEKKQLREDIASFDSEQKKLNLQHKQLSEDKKKLSNDQKKLAKEQKEVSRDRDDISKYHKQLSQTKDEFRLKKECYECELTIMRTELLCVDKPTLIMKKTQDVATWTVKEKSSEASTNTDDQKEYFESSDIQSRLMKLEEQMNKQNMAYHSQQQYMPSPMNASPDTVRTQKYLSQPYNHNVQHYQSPSYYHNHQHQHMYDPPCRALYFS